MLDETLRVTIPKIWDELPEIFGDEWTKVEREIWELLRRLEGGDAEAAVAIVELLKTAPEAYALLKSVANDVTPQTKSGLPAGALPLERYVAIPVMYGHRPGTAWRWVRRRA